MTQLIHKSTQQILIKDLEVADGFISRTLGLLKYSNLSDEKAMWIHQCKSIHTFFMKFSIDCVFVDKELKIKKIFKSVSPWKMTWPVFSADSVIEMKAGRADQLGLKVGDYLYVEP